MVGLPKLLIDISLTKLIMCNSSVIVSTFVSVMFSRLICLYGFCGNFPSTLVSKLLNKFIVIVTLKDAVDIIPSYIFTLLLSISVNILLGLTLNVS